MDRKKTVSLCMIVKNEEKYLGKCLSSVKDVVDEMIVVDTGSTDSTVEIAKKFGAKVLDYQWDQNFSNARNFSILPAVSDWILLMDGDDQLEKDDIDKLIRLVNESDMDGHYFRTLSYVGSEPGKDVVFNLNLRLLRNNKKYRFMFPIHEQIVDVNGQTDYSRFPAENIRVHHYGYLNTVAIEKNKRRRNIEIIQAELEKEPNNRFQLFNLANEYYAMGQLEKTAELFDQVYENINTREGYAVKLIIRRIMCLDEMGQYDRALTAIKEGLDFYPGFTDLSYLRGCIYLKLRRYTLALDSFERCIEMGGPPVHLEYLNGCGTYRPFQALGEIYYKLEDYDKAMICYEKALSYDGTLREPLNKIAAILNTTVKNKRLVSFKLSQYFDLRNSQQLVLLAKILIGEGLYDIARGYLEKAEEMDPHNPVITYCMGSVLFYQKQYAQAASLLSEIGEDPGLKENSFRYLFVIGMITKDSERLSGLLEKRKDAEEELIYRTYLQFFNIYAQNDDICLNLEDDHEKILQITMNVLEEVLKLKDFPLFENLLNILNCIESKKVLLKLAQLYDRNGFGQMAVQEILRSVKEFDVIDQEGIEILYRQLY